MAMGEHRSSSSPEDKGRPAGDCRGAQEPPSPDPGESQVRVLLHRSPCLQSPRVSAELSRPATAVALLATRG
ncbi:hypothetical protein EYF80_066145 [Liparis tanakae]|uniref:Uncharacterized protein n=1 Tax=Liparis tanakae TaxID=230148 RepID=A0A4Z2E4W9_9TELE|nr:hypothetical protein EYF80_066145 [Liparis tanakae]